MRSIEPDAVERVGDVVVMRDVAPVAAMLMQEELDARRQRAIAAVLDTAPTIDSAMPRMRRALPVKSRSPCT